MWSMPWGRSLTPWAPRSATASPGRQPQSASWMSQVCEAGCSWAGLGLWELAGWHADWQAGMR